MSLGRTLVRVRVPGVSLGRTLVQVRVPGVTLTRVVYFFPHVTAWKASHFYFYYCFFRQGA